MAPIEGGNPDTNGAQPKKLHGRAFYESLGSPKFIVAPMVDQSEFAWRMLSRSFLSEDEKSKFLAYTPMLHARLFATEEKYRRKSFEATRPDSPAGEPHLDGNPAMDRPLFVQFCANDPDHLLAAAQKVAPHCDAVDLNLGCPQGIARKGHYGAFLQEDQALVYSLINRLHRELSVPVTAKIRILEMREQTLEYARNVLAAGASILTVHGRRREMKGHLTGVADWKMIRFLRDNLPPETVLFANGNILQGKDVQECLDATGVDGVMSAEGNLSDPGIFAEPPTEGQEGREYWRGRDGRGGWRVDAVTRRYLDIIHKYALGTAPPQRRPLFIPGDDTAWLEEAEQKNQDDNDEGGEDGPARKRRKKDKPTATTTTTGKKDDHHAPSPNLSAIQPHLFHLLRHLVSKHTDVRDQLARARRDGLPGYEAVLAAVERKVARGLLEHEQTGGQSWRDELAPLMEDDGLSPEESSLLVRREYKRPWWVVQPIIRPLPAEALKKGAVQVKKKDRLGGLGKGGKTAEGGADQGKPAVGGNVTGKRKAEGEEVERQGQGEEIKQRDELVSG